MPKDTVLDDLLRQAARSEGLPAATTEDPAVVLAAAEAAEDLFRTWAEHRETVLDGRSPRDVAAALRLDDLLAAVASGSLRRGGRPPRLLADELVRRLDRESDADAASPTGSPTLTALGSLASAEPEDVREPAAAALAAMQILAQWGQPAAIPWLMTGLAAEHPDLRNAAAAGLGSIGLPALPAIIRALSGTADPHLRRGLYESLTSLPQVPDVERALTTSWGAATAEERQALAEGIGRHGHRTLAPLLVTEAAHPALTRRGWATYRVALQRLGHAAMSVPAPQPDPQHPELDLLAGCHILLAADLQAPAREWLQEALLHLERQAEQHPAAVDWYLYERFQHLADLLWNRSPELRAKRFAGYAAGALQYYGVLRLSELLSLVAMATGMAEPDPAALWSVLSQDRRLMLNDQGLVALADVADTAALLERRQAAGLPPALLPIEAMALGQRGLLQLAWTALEAEAAQRLIPLLPEDLATPVQVVALQRAIRSTQSDAESREAFRDWLRQALTLGMEPTQELKDAMAELWNHTARWDLFGHTPWSAREISEMLVAQREAQPVADDPCACGSGQPYAGCCGRKH